MHELKGKKLIVTGGAGFIGSHLCSKLLEHGAEVLSIDDFSAGKEVNLDHLKDYKNFTSLKKDVCDKEGFDAIFDGADVVFHNAASKKNVCLVNPQRDLEVNAGGTLNFLQLARQHNVRKFVHASTGSVYGEPIEFPTDEQHALRPVSYYGVSKLAGERYVDTFHRLYDMDTTILRYFHVYGPRQEFNEFGGVVSIFIRQIVEGGPITIFGDGDQIRSFTAVEDLVEANIRAAVKPVSKGKVYNAASGIKVSINDLAYNIRRIMAREDIPIQHGDPLIGDIRYFDVSNAAIQRELGIKFRQNFWENLQHTINDVILDLKKSGVSSLEACG